MTQEKTYTQEDLDKARAEGYENGEEAGYESGWDIGFDSGVASCEDKD